MYTFNIDPNKNEKQFQKYSSFFITLRGVFLALILFCASFLVPYLGCNYQIILEQQEWTRYLILYLVIYFSINLTDPDIDSQENPIYIIFKTTFVFIIFLLLNNISMNSIIMMLVLFSLLILTSKYYHFYKNQNSNYEYENVSLDLLYVIQFILATSIIVLLFVSLITNSNQKHTKKHLLGKCNL